MPEYRNARIAGKIVYGNRIQRGPPRRYRPRLRTQPQHSHSPHRGTRAASNGTQRQRMPFLRHYAGRLHRGKWKQAQSPKAAPPTISDYPARVIVGPPHLWTMPALSTKTAPLTPTTLPPRPIHAHETRRLTHRRHRGISHNLFTGACPTSCPDNRHRQTNGERHDGGGHRSTDDRNPNSC